MSYNIRTILTLLALTSAASYATADIPAGYYSTLKGKKDAELKTAVHEIIKNFVHPTDNSGYNSTYSALSTTFQKTDLYPNSKRWWDMYSDETFYAPSFSGLNREHSFPKSWWGGDTNIPPYIDLNHLYPSEMRANTAKSNYPLGEVDRSYATKFDNGISTVGYAVKGQGGGANYVFEPADEYKGDFARTYFYMATAYQDLNWKYTYMTSSNTYPTLNDWSVEMLLRWHREDPVSTKELDRNEAVYLIQNNRNPFIDYPELAEYIWGDHMGETFDPGTASNPTGTPELITPVKDQSLDFADVAVGKSTVSQLFFRGENLTGDLYVAISKRSENHEMFSLPVSTISHTLVNTTSGYYLPVTYAPTAEGEHSVRLIVTGSDIESKYPTGFGIDLIGHAFPVPSLTAPTAESPSDITSTSYVANWRVPEGETIDYCIVTRTRYIGGSQTVEQIEAEGTSLLIEDFDQSDYEAYSVQSVRLGYYSPSSNQVILDHSAVTGVTVDEPLTVIPMQDAVRIQVASPHTGCRIFDALGRLVTVIAEVSDNMDISLRPGVYLITTDQCTRPVKAAIK